MKAKTNVSKAKSRRGFTLVEMLVVIGMIAALAGISFPVYKSIQAKVDKQRLEMDINALERAVDNFVLEYNYMPYIGTAYPAADDDYTGAEVTSLFTVLVGLPNAAHTANFKQIEFFEAREAKGGPGNYSDGLIISGNTAQYYLPWGGREIYFMRLDHSMDGIITFGYGLGAHETDLKYIYADKGPDDQWGSAADPKDDFINYDPSDYQ